MKVILAYPRDGHNADERVDYEPAVAGQLVRDGFARYPSADDDEPTRVSVSTDDVKAYARANGVTQNEARLRLREQAALAADPNAATTTLPATVPAEQ